VHARVHIVSCQKLREPVRPYGAEAFQKNSHFAYLCAKTPLWQGGCGYHIGFHWVLMKGVP
jgi:hypothetical protein